MPQPASRDGSIHLLDLAGPLRRTRRSSISAIPTRTGKDQDAKVLLRQALDQELLPRRRGIARPVEGDLSGHQFYLFETRRGIEQHVLLATTLDDYILRVVLAAHDEKVVKQAGSLIRARRLSSRPTSSRQHLAADAQAYDGPSISSHRMATLESDPPAKHI